MKNRSAASLLSFADSFTIVNGLMGLFSIFLAISGEMVWASSFILFAVLADGMDGIVARKLGSDIGKYMDEFSDVVSFCVAPIISVYIIYGTSFVVTVENIFLLFSYGIFFIGGMLHLIRYHIGDEGYFVGLATPSAAMTVITVLYLSPPWWCMSLVLFILSVIMMSSIPYPKVEGMLSVPAVAVIMLAIVLGNEFYILLLVSIVSYIIFGPAYVIHRSKTSKIQGSDRW